MPTKLKADHLRREMVIAITLKVSRGWKFNSWMCFVVYISHEMVLDVLRDISRDRALDTSRDGLWNRARDLSRDDVGLCVIFCVKCRVSVCIPPNGAWWETEIITCE